MLLTSKAIKRFFVFPPHLNDVSLILGKTGNPEIASFVFASSHEELVTNTTWHN